MVVARLLLLSGMQDAMIYYPAISAKGEAPSQLDIVERGRMEEQCAACKIGWRARSKSSATTAL